MVNSRSKKSFVYLKVLPMLLCSLFIVTASAQNDAILVIKGQTLLKSRAKGAGLNVGVKSVSWKEEAMEGVDIEIKKNGVTILKISSEKKGKYSFQVPVSTADAKNDYVVYFTKEGMAPRMVNINAFIPKPEFAKFSAAKYELELDMPLIATTVTDIVPDKAYAKIKWDNVKEHKFVIDPVYAKTSLGEEHKIEGNPDMYFTSLVKKKKKQEDALAKNKAAADAKQKALDDAKKKTEEEARLKAEAEAKVLADKKAKEEADRIAREQAEALRLKRIADSLALAAKNKAKDNTSAQTEVPTTTPKVTEPVEQVEVIEIKNPYNVAETFSINIARRSLNAEREKRNREKSRNLSAKYETINTLTSLLNEVDEFDKMSKRQ